MRSICLKIGWRKFNVEIISILFWIAIGLLYLGVHFPLPELLIGGCALVLGIVLILGLLRPKR
jgi:hypothetical protein